MLAEVLRKRSMFGEEEVMKSMTREHTKHSDRRSRCGWIKRGDYLLLLQSEEWSFSNRLVRCCCLFPASSPGWIISYETHHIISWNLFILNYVRSFREAVASRYSPLFKKKFGFQFHVRCLLFYQYH